MRADLSPHCSLETHLPSEVCQSLENLPVRQVPVESQNRGPATLTCHIFATQELDFSPDISTWHISLALTRFDNLINHTGFHGEALPLCKPQRLGWPQNLLPHKVPHALLGSISLTFINLDEKEKHERFGGKISSKQVPGSPHQLDVLAVGQRCVSNQPSNIGGLRSSGGHGIRFEE